MFAHLFQLVLAVDALQAKNMIQIMGLLIFNSLFLVYSIIQVRLPSPPPQHSPDDVGRLPRSTPSSLAPSSASSSGSSPP